MKKLLLSTAIWLGLIAPTFAQQVIPNVLSGNECWNAGQGPGGPSTGFVCAYLIRNGSALSIITGTGAFTTLVQPQQSVLYWTGTAPTSWTITTPANPFDGEIIQIATDTTLTSMVTLTPNTGQTLDSAYTSQTLSATSSVEFEYNLAAAKWYRMR